MQDFAVGMGHSEQLHRAECALVEGDAARGPIDIDVGDNRVPITVGSYRHFISFLNFQTRERVKVLHRSREVRVVRATASPSNSLRCLGLLGHRWYALPSTTSSAKHL